MRRWERGDVPQPDASSHSWNVGGLGRAPPDDRENYRRPITRHRAWRRTPETTILEYDCDPHPFFRGLEIEGTLNLYWERMRRRQ